MILIRILIRISIKFWTRRSPKTHPEGSQGLLESSKMVPEALWKLPYVAKGLLKWFWRAPVGSKRVPGQFQEALEASWRAPGSVLGGDREQFLINVGTSLNQIELFEEVFLAWNTS